MQLSPLSTATGQHTQPAAMAANLMPAATTAPTGAMAYTVAQVVGLFQVSRSVVFEELKSGRLRSYQVGRRRYISTQAAADWQARLEREAAEKIEAAADLV